MSSDVANFATGLGVYDAVVTNTANSFADISGAVGTGDLSLNFAGAFTSGGSLASSTTYNTPAAGNNVGFTVTGWYKTPTDTTAPAPLVDLTTWYPPNLMTGCNLWFDFNSPDCITGTTTNVTGILDKSGMGNNSFLTAPVTVEGFTSSAQITPVSVLGDMPGPGLNVLNLTATAFEGSMNSLGNAFSGSQMTYFAVVADISGGPNAGRLTSFASYGGSTTDASFTTLNVQVSPSVAAPTGAVRFQMNPTFVDVSSANISASAFGVGTTNFHIVSFYFNSGVFYYGVDGSYASVSNTVTSPNLGFTNWCIGRDAQVTTGGNAVGNMYLGELLMYASAPTTAQRQSIEGYLATKWKLQSKLPTSHPYYATAFPYYNHITLCVSGSTLLVPSAMPYNNVAPASNTLALATTAGSWNFFAYSVCCSGGTQLVQSLWSNGTSVSATGGSYTSFAINRTTLGYGSSYASSYFNGKIDDYRYYNRVLTSMEIRVLNTYPYMTSTDVNNAASLVITPSIGGTPTVTMVGASAVFTLPSSGTYSYLTLYAQSGYTQTTTTVVYPSTMTPSGASSYTYTLNGLTGNTAYVFWMVPYVQSTPGSASVTLTGTTGDVVPVTVTPSTGVVTGLSTSNGVAYSCYALTSTAQSYALTYNATSATQIYVMAVGGGGGGGSGTALPVAFPSPPALGVTANAMYAVNWVNANYTGPIMNLRRSTDNATQDFYVDAFCNTVSTLAGGLGTSLTNWVGTGSAYVTTWYDQSTMGVNAVQTNTALQPVFDPLQRFVNFNAGRYLNIVSASGESVPRTYAPNGYTVSVKHGAVPGGVGGNMYAGILGIGSYFTTASGNTNAFRTQPGGIYLNYWFGNDFQSNASLVANNNTVTWVCNSSGSESIYVNGTVQGSASVRTGLAAPLTNATIGMTALGTEFLNGPLYGVFLFPAALTATQQAAVEALYVTAFTPTLFAGPMLWLDANDPNYTGVQPNSAAILNTWKDKSGGLRDASSSVGVMWDVSGLAKRPAFLTNNSTASASQHFAGYMSITGATATVFVVAQITANTPTNGRAFGMGVSGTSDSTGTGYMSMLRYGGGTGIGGHRNTHGQGIDTTLAAQITYQPQIALCYFDGVTNMSWSILNGGTNWTAANYALSSGNFAVSYYTIGVNNNTTLDPWAGYVSEVLVYNTNLSDIHRATVEGYLAWKWGLQNYLPSIHPFNSFAPMTDVWNYQFRIKGVTSTVPTKDATGNYTITNTGTVAMTIDSSGYVFNLTGTNYLSIAGAAGLTGTNCTRTMWVKTSTPTTGTGNVFSSTSWPIWFAITNFMGSQVSYTGGTRIVDPTNEGTGWVFYAFTTSATSQAMYVNGGTTPVATSSTAWSGDATTIQFGAQGGAQNYYTGKLDDMRQYNYVLTPQQIQQIYTATYNQYTALTNVNSVSLAIVPYVVSYNLVVSPTIQTVTFTYTGGDQYYTIPSWATTATFECWGAGGARYGFGSAVQYNTGYGGAGGYTSANFNVASYAGSSAKIIVGQGGQTANGGAALPATYGGGGASTSDSGWGIASGGGRTAIQLAVGASYVEMITAGGGGGAGIQSYSSTSSSLNTPYSSGGAGGGLVGGHSYEYITANNAVSYGGGAGGTQTAGGAAGSQNNTGTAGSQYTGGASANYGAGGGGGWYGGGGGALSANPIGQWIMAGGGGGSSYVNNGLGTMVSMLQGNNWSTSTQYNNVRVANDAGLPARLQGGKIGYGAPATATNAFGAAGGNGFVRVTFYKAGTGGGGGGAGGVVMTPVTLPAGSGTMTVSVGAGGATAAIGSSTAVAFSVNSALNVTALGGGGGGAAGSGGSGGGGASALDFTPGSVPGLTLWLDAADTATITSSSNNVTQWNDKSGLGYHFTSSSNPRTGTKTINGLNVIDTGTNSTANLNNASIPIGPNYTMFFVAHQTACQAQCNLFSNSYMGMVTYNYSYNALMSNGTTWSTGTRFPNSGMMSSPSIMEFMCASGGVGVMYHNGISSTSNQYQYYKDGTMPGGMTLSTNNASSQWLGNIAEVIVYNNCLSTANRQKVEGYLAWKWGLQGKLPAIHPWGPGSSELFPVTPDVMNFQFRVKSLVNSVPTFDTSGTYAITNSSVAMTADPARGWVFNLTGANYLSIAGATGLTGAYCTRTFWVKFPGNTTNSYSWVFSSGAWPIYYNSNNTALTVGLGGTIGYGTGGSYSRDPIYEGSGWVFYAFTATPTAQTIYVNGGLTPVNVQPVTGTAWSADATAIYFGALAGTPGVAPYNFTGQLDDMRQYNYVLTPQQIQQIYNATNNYGTNPVTSTFGTALATNNINYGNPGGKSSFFSGAGGGGAGTVGQGLIGNNAGGQGVPCSLPGLNAFSTYATSYFGGGGGGTAVATSYGLGGAGGGGAAGKSGTPNTGGGGGAGSTTGGSGVVLLAIPKNAAVTSTLTAVYSASQQADASYALVMNSLSSTALKAAEVALACRLVNVNYFGPTLTLRHPVDLTGAKTQNFYADVFGNLFTGYGNTGTALADWMASFTTANSPNTATFAYVVQWYDQAMDASFNNATQYAPGYQPVYDVSAQIVNFGYTTNQGYTSTDPYLVNSFAGVKCISYYPFNGDMKNYATGYGVTDAAVRYGTVISLAPAASARLGTGCLYSSANQYTDWFQLPRLPQNVNGYTWSCWVNLSNTGTGHVWYFARLYNHQDNIRYFLWSTGGNLYIGGGGSATNTVIVTTFAINRWYHVVWTLTTGGSTNVWVDGAQVLTNNATYGYINFSAYGGIVAPYLFCGIFNTADTGATGYLDDFRYYDGVITAAQVAQLFTYTGQGTAVNNQANYPSTWMTSTTQTKGALNTTNPNCYLNYPTGDLPVALPVPLQMPGLQLWLDAADPYGDGTQPLHLSSLTGWTDKSGLGNHATASVGVAWTNNGLGGRPAFLTNNSSASISQHFAGPMSITGATATVFVVAQTTANTGIYGRTFSMGTVGATDWNSTNYMTMLRYNNGTGIGVQRNGHGQGVDSTLAFTANSPQIADAWFDGTSMYWSNMNGASTTITNYGPSTGNFAVSYYMVGSNIYVNSTDCWAGYISEVLVYNTTLTAAQRQQVEGYLAWKWNLSSTLPTTHPYYYNMSVPITNYNFASPVVSANNSSYTTSITGWTCVGGTVVYNGSIWSFINAPTTQYAGIQSTGSISQSLMFAATGTYLLSFYAAPRPVGNNSNAYHPSHQLQVLIDDVVVYTSALTHSYAWSLLTVPFNITSTGSHTLKFQTLYLYPVNDPNYVGAAPDSTIAFANIVVQLQYPLVDASYSYLLKHGAYVPNQLGATVISGGANRTMGAFALELSGNYQQDWNGLVATGGVVAANSTVSAVYNSTGLTTGSNVVTYTNGAGATTATGPATRQQSLVNNAVGANLMTTGPIGTNLTWSPPAFNGQLNHLYVFSAALGNTDRLILEGTPSATSTALALTKNTPYALVPAYSNIAVNSVTFTSPYNKLVSGTSTYNGQTYNVYAFTQTGGSYTLNYSCSMASQVYVLAVGGGGGGGSGGGAGGGGGGVVMKSVALPAGFNQTVTVSVGAGGAASASGGSSLVQFGANGALNVTAYGGGAGRGLSGGSGGGASVASTLGFVPTHLVNSGIMLWLDANDPSGTGIQPSNGSVLNTWRDKSGGNRDASSSVGVTWTSTGLNGKPAFLTNNSSASASQHFAGYVSITGATATVFTVAQMTANTSMYGRVISMNAVGAADWNSTSYMTMLRQSYSTGIGPNRNGHGQGQGTDGTLTFAANQPQIADTWFDGTSMYWSNMNGASTTIASYGSTGNFAISTYMVGSSTFTLNDFWAGYISETLVYNTTLSDVHRATVEGYLAWKWGLQATLAPTHLYYYVAPMADILSYQFRLKGTTSTVITKDATGTYTITNNASVTMVADATRGYVFNLSGSNYLSIAGVAGLTGTYCTRTFWAKTGTPTAGGGGMFTSSNAWFIGYNGSNNMWSWQSVPGTNLVTYDPANEGTGWVFFAVTMSPTTMSIYANGGLTPVTTRSVAWSGDANKIQFGAWMDGNNYTGLLDDMRQYSSVLSPTEIQQIYNATKNYGINATVPPTAMAVPNTNAQNHANVGSAMVAGGGGGAGMSFPYTSTGGSGIQCTLPGINTFAPAGTAYGTYYWGGGGGGSANATTAGTGGLGGGGGGSSVSGPAPAPAGTYGINAGTAGTNAETQPSMVPFLAPTVGGAGGKNTGGGGGGSYISTGGQGGSGIVVLAFPQAPIVTNAAAVLSTALVNNPLYYDMVTRSGLSTAAYAALKGGFSCCLVNYDYFGPVFTLRHSLDISGSNTQNFYADVLGNLGTQYLGTGMPLVAWLSMNGANTNYAYVTKWYNQGLDASFNSAFQYVLGSQPVYEVGNRVVNFGYASFGAAYPSTWANTSTASNAMTFTNPNCFLNLAQNALPCAPSTPLQMPGLVLWLDAADPYANGTQPANAASLTAWADKSGLRNHAMAVNGVPWYSAGLNSAKPAFLTKTTAALGDHFMGGVSITGTTATVFLVTQSTANTGINSRICMLGVPSMADWISGIGFSMQSGATGSSAVNVYRSSNGSAAAGNLVAANAPNVAAGWFDGSAVYAIKQCGTSTAIGSSSSIGNSFGISSYTIGNNSVADLNTAYSFSGYVSEVLVYNTVLTTAQRQQVEGYLSWKWGLQANLPAAHPYYSINNASNTSDTSYSYVFRHGAYVPNQLGATVLSGGVNAANQAFALELSGNYQQDWYSTVAPGGTAAAVNTTVSATYAATGTATGANPITYTNGTAVTTSNTVLRQQAAGNNAIGTNLAWNEPALNAQMHYLYAFNTALTSADRAVVEATNVANIAFNPSAMTVTKSNVSATGFTASWPMSNQTLTYAYFINGVQTTAAVPTFASGQYTITYTGLTGSPYTFTVVGYNSNNTVAVYGSG